jgi:hypothetical protein
MIGRAALRRQRTDFGSAHNSPLLIIFRMRGILAFRYLMAPSTAPASY